MSRIRNLPALAVIAGELLFRGGGAPAGTTPPVKMTKEEDHKRTMDLQHITELRRGKAGRDKTDPNFANYDESKVTPKVKWQMSTRRLVRTATLIGDIAFRQHSSGHTDQPNWLYFINFAATNMALK